MDDSQFDALARSLNSRRAALAGLLGGAGAWLGLASEEGAAHNFKARCHQLSNPAKRRACLRRARAHNRTHRCKPKPPAQVCGGRCRGTAVNNCGQRVACPACPGEKSCLVNGSCARICGPAVQNCPAGCFCIGVPEVGNGHYCVPFTITSCEQIPQVCTSTADCPLGSACLQGACPGPDGQTAENRCAPLCPS